MMKKKRWLISLSLFALTGITLCDAAEAYRFVKEIPIGGQGGWDYLAVDAAARRLYVSHATKVVVIDLAGERVMGEITNTPGVHGIAVAPDLDRIYVSNGRDNTAGIVDPRTLQMLSRVGTGANPDTILYEPEHHEVYAFNGRGHSATVFDAKSGKVLATIELGGRPEFAVVDPKAGRIYDNLEDKNEVVVIDTATHKMLNRWPIAPGEAASGMALDAVNHRLFLGCHNKLMVMMDSTDGRVVATVPIGEGVDANAFDPATQLAFASCRDGTTTIAHEDAPDKLTLVQTLATERGSRTMTLDPRTHRIYLSAAKFGPAPESDAGARRQRPRMIPDTFKVLVYGLEKTNH